MALEKSKKHKLSKNTNLKEEGPQSRPPTLPPPPVLAQDLAPSQPVGESLSGIDMTIINVYASNTSCISSTVVAFGIFRN